MINPWNSAISPWIAKGVIVAATAAMIAIRAPHGQRSRTIPVVKQRKGSLEIGLLILAMLGFVVPLIWLVSRLFAFADYPLRMGSLLAGVVCFVAGLWLFYRSHADLGRNWSVTLELRDQHRLITHGVYRKIRHPMYTALFLYSIGQALVLPNWIAGPSYLITFGILFAFRVLNEEAMLRDYFGEEYSVYMQRSKRLVPYVW